jgi:hypothetical protein
MRNDWNKTKLEAEIRDRLSSNSEDKEHGPEDDKQRDNLG